MEHGCSTGSMTDTAVAPRGERLRILIGFARPHRNTLLLGLVLSLVATAMGLATPMVTKWVLDSLSGGLSLAKPIALLLGLLVVGSAVGLALSLVATAMGLATPMVTKWVLDSLSEGLSPVSYTHLTLPTICSV